MKFKFFLIPIQNYGGPEEELNKFFGSHRIAAMEKHFVNDGQNSCWSICISYIEPSNLQHLNKKGQIDYREVLNETDFAGTGTGRPTVTGTGASALPESSNAAG